MRKYLAALVLLTMLPLAMASWAEDAPKTNDPLPGAETTVELALKRADAIVIATVSGKADIVSRGSSVVYPHIVVDGEDSGTREAADSGKNIDAYVRQQFDIKTVFSGSIPAGNVTLEYSYVESSETRRPGKPLEVSGDKLILLVRTKRLLKAILASDANLAIVKKLLAATK